MRLTTKLLIRIIIKRTLAALFGIGLIVLGIMLMMQQMLGNGIDINQEKWSIGFIPGSVWVIILTCVPMVPGVYLLIYAIRGFLELR